MRSRRKLNFAHADSKARRKRLMFVLSNPEEAESEVEIERACEYAEWMTDRMEQATESVQDLLEDEALWDRLHKLSDDTADALDRLRKSIESIEAVLVEKYRGRCASVELDSDWALLFWHTSGKWGLYTINGKSVIQRLTSAPKRVRVLAVPAIEDLWHQLQYEDEAA